MCCCSCRDVTEIEIVFKIESDHIFLLRLVRTKTLINKEKNTFYLVRMQCNILFIWLELNFSSNNANTVFGFRFDYQHQHCNYNYNSVVFSLIIYFHCSSRIKYGASRFGFMRHLVMRHWRTNNVWCYWCPDWNIDARFDLRAAEECRIISGWLKHHSVLHFRWLKI